ncbi:MAG: hypothetical protein WB797_14220 [Nocardioides sp.]
MSRVRFLRSGVLACAMVSAALVPSAAGSAAAGTTAGAHVAKAKWSPDAGVRAILVSHKRVYIAGDFTHLRNTSTGHRVTRDRVAAFNRTTGALVKRFHPNVNGEVRALAVLGHKLVIGGEFTTVDQKNRQHLAAVNAGSGHLTHWKASVDGPVFALLSMRGDVYVGGDFEHADGQFRPHLFALDGQAVLSSTWPDQAAGGTDHGVYTLAASAGRHAVLVGGAFRTLAGSPRPFLGEIARGSGDVTAWAPAPLCSGPCFVNGLAVDDHFVYAGIAGPGGAAVAYRGDTAATVWSKHTDGDVTGVALAGKRLVIGGHFTHVHKHPHPMFAELVASSGKVTSRKPATTGTAFPGVLAVDVHDGRIRLGGDFQGIAGQRRYAILPE